MKNNRKKRYRKYEKQQKKEIQRVCKTTEKRDTESMKNNRKKGIRRL